MDVIVTLRVRSLRGVHRTNDSHLIDVLGSLHEMLAEHDAGDIGADGLERATDIRGGVGLGVEGVDVGHATGHVEVDDVLGLAF
jgi:hypothetical protein